MIEDISDITENFLFSIEDISSSKSDEPSALPFVSPPVNWNFVEPIKTSNILQKGV